ncbi:hypothetical protein AAW12_24335 [Sphingobacterium sp. Ag1]|uniref:hypothetical protein n=1 Tax=Sphingobacterium sp. Ag1 TaxID=1643451 RepID=UPI0006280292|nr:hypothetical protein [Sphingobacterium sp. Ag1]KKO89240.1 hypothetical protein AAW12_24335 [Sphingobacterium sp. Ag1]
MKNKRLSKESKIAIVCAIASGNLLIQEAMEKYHVAKKSTIISWIKTLLTEARERMENARIDQAVTKRSDLENIGIRMFERIEKLEKERLNYEIEKSSLKERISNLEAKLGDEN